MGIRVAPCYPIRQNHTRAVATSSRPPRCPSSSRPLPSTRAVRSHSKQAACAQRVGLGLEHGAVLEERRVAAGQLEQIARSTGSGDSRPAARSSASPNRSTSSPSARSAGVPSRIAAPRRSQGVDVDVALGEDASHPGVGVLHVRRRVAVHRQHLVVAEDVVARAILREVGVLERADADALGDSRRARRRKARGRRAWRRRCRRRSCPRGGPLRPSSPSRPTVSPARVLNGRPSLPSTVPKLTCWSSTSSKPISRAVANSCSKCMLWR